MFPEREFHFSEFILGVMEYERFRGSKSRSENVAIISRNRPVPSGVVYGRASTPPEWSTAGLPTLAGSGLSQTKGEGGGYFPPLLTRPLSSSPQTPLLQSPLTPLPFTSYRTDDTIPEQRYCVTERTF